MTDRVGRVPGFKMLGRLDAEPAGVYDWWDSFDGVYLRRLRRTKTRARWKEEFGLIRAAHRVLRPGDRVRCARCGGARPTYTFTGWSNFTWAASKTRDDLYPGGIDRVNGEPVDFRELARAMRR